VRPVIPTASSSHLQGVAPEELDLQTAVELLAKKAARNAAKAAKAAASSSEGAASSATAPSTARKTRASKPRAAKAGASKPKATKGSSKTTSGKADLGSSASGKPGRRRKPAGASDEASAAVASSSGSRQALDEATGSIRTAAPAKADNGSGGAGSRKTSAWTAFRKARWNAVKAQHGGVAGREVSVFCLFEREQQLHTAPHDFHSMLFSTLQWCCNRFCGQTQLLHLPPAQLFSAVNKALGEEWRALNPEEKATYAGGTSADDRQQEAEL
jgi:hypothetical protein